MLGIALGSGYDRNSASDLLEEDQKCPGVLDVFIAKY